MLGTKFTCIIVAKKFQCYFTPASSFYSQKVSLQLNSTQITTMKFSSTISALFALAPAVGAFTAVNNADRLSTRLQAGKDEMSQALPFIKRPANLDGSFPGDVGFE